MRFLVLGAGQQGSACAFDLLTRTDAEVVIADREVGALAPFLAPFRDGRLSVRRLDAADRAAADGLLEGVTATMCAFPYYLNPSMTEAAINALIATNDSISMPP